MTTSPGLRWIGVDAARGLALVGMMAVHILPSRDPDDSISTAYFLASGRSSALFAILAGVGLALAYGRDQAPEGTELRKARAGIVARAAVIGFIGLLLGEIDSGVAVILVNYGFLFLAGALLVGLSRRAALVTGAIWVVVAPLLSHWLRGQLPDPALYVPGIDELADPITFLREIFLTGYYPVAVWIAYLLIGLGLGRGKRPGWGVVGVGIALAGVAKFGSSLLLELVDPDLGEIPIQFFGTTPTSSAWFLALSTPHSGTPFDLAHTIGTSLAVVGICSLIDKALGWIAAAGAMTLSLYTFHVVALSAGPNASPMDLFVIHALAAIFLGWVWRRLVGKGPLESLTANVSQTARQLIGQR